jgi:hypothetical protein
MLRVLAAVGVSAMILSASSTAWPAEPAVKEAPAPAPSASPPYRSPWPPTFTTPPVPKTPEPPPFESPWPPAPPPPPETAAPPAETPIPPPPKPLTKAEAEKIYLEWATKIRLIEVRLLRPPDGKGWDQGRQEILAIDDEMAAGPMVDVLYGPNPRYRLLLIEALSRLAAVKSKVAAAYLQEIVVGDAGPGQRLKAVEGLKAAAKAGIAVTDRLLVHLALDEIAVFRDRAATALAALGDKRAVYLLIERLVTEDIRIEMVEEATLLPLSGGGSVSLVGPPTFRRVVVQGVAPGGAVAQTVIDLPQADVSDYGIGGWYVGRTVVPKEQRVLTQHPDILAALKVLTGKDFGFNADAWRKWTSSTEASAIIPRWEPLKFAAE